MKISSTDFEEGGFIPKRFTCQGSDVNPLLFIEGLPEGTQSLAIIVDDPDAPLGTWIHWVMYDIPPTTRIEENTAPGKQGTNDFGNNKYGGPCPPMGTHRYFFKVYALDKMLGIPEGKSKQDLQWSMQGHILANAELMGKYKKE